MKEWKLEFVNKIIEKAHDERIISISDIARDLGINHISSGDVRDILSAAQKVLPDFRPIRMMKTPHDSLFQSLCLVDRVLEFENGGE